ncbi:molybdopterin cofactor-binding domain-containing protein [Plastoroseomonas arctica]|uniref:Xanthine dehydrogenase family protein molybdopterin-binding subunit n=1 Tax=Plastoroseomonas arctica TaxID=1509237 RepID=A0AAF1JU86_9PROT|nr:molybdopterin cofactor-binding domain-containing protein [Plastoroseomonas arctica]MBR0653692.1 xanthine dehydrogenase family protein molybdopterin-binding subunit [Plastoroseomonas arctica]
MSATLPASLAANPRLSQWLGFTPDGAVVIRPGKVEIGQGILTALTQIAADELDVAIPRIRIETVATPTSPDEGVTSGSLSVQNSGVALRHVCAEARAIFLGVAAQGSGVPIEALRVEDGDFVGPQGAVGSYWTLAERGLLDGEATPGARAKPPAARVTAGTSTARLDLPDKVFGRPRFLHDMHPAGLLHARVLRLPSRGATLREVAPGPLPEGATLVRDGSFLAVLAEAEHVADKALARLARLAQWDEHDTLPDEGAMPAWLRQAAGESSVVAEHDRGEAPATRRIKRDFFRPLVAHASVGPSCAMACWTGEAVEVWSHTQGPYNLRLDLAKALRIPVESVVVRHVEGAGCYGHNGADDVALDAALAARGVPGRTVRVLWSRADELGWSPFSSAMLVEVEAGLDDAGNIAEFRLDVTSNGHSSRPGRGALPTLLAASTLDPPFAVPLAINMPVKGGGGAQRNAVPIYRIGKLNIGMRTITDMPIRTSAMRGLGAPVNVWAIEAAMDELAGLAGEDPLAFRLRHLDDARAAAVLQRAADMAGWAQRGTAEGTGMGLAVARYKNLGAWCAVVAEVAAEAEVRATRIWIAADLGEVVNPDGAVNQLEGSAIHATSQALKEAVRFDRRRVTSDSWDSYPILRFSEVPKVDVALIDRPEMPPLGAGEPAFGPTVAAIANAIHAALGVRPRAMPFTAANLAAAMET